MIKAFPPDRTDQPFNAAVLPWRLWRGWSVTNAHDAKPPFEKRAVDAVAVADDIFTVSAAAIASSTVGQEREKVESPILPAANRARSRRQAAPRLPIVSARCRNHPR